MTHTHNQMRFAAASAMLLFAATGCIQENLYNPAGISDGPTISATIEEPLEEASETRVSVSLDETSATGGKLYFYWTPEDEIGVFTDASENNVLYKNTESVEKVKTVTFAPASPVSGTPTYAYYPYSSEAGADMSAVKGQISSSQTINASLDNVPGIYRYGYYKSTSGNSHSFGFKHVFSTVRFHLNVAGTPLDGCKLQDIEIAVKRGTQLVPICGDFTFNAQTGAHVVGSNTSNTIKVSFAGQPVVDKEITFYTTLFPNIKKNDVLYFTVNTAEYTTTYKVKSSVAFAKNNLYTYSMPIKKYSGVTYTSKEVNLEPVDIPEITSFSFNVEDNDGKLINNELVWNTSSHNPSFKTLTEPLKASINNETNEITLTIPYLYDFNLKPTFTVDGEDTVVKVKGQVQESGVTEVDFTRPVTYTVTNSDGGTRYYTVKIKNSGLPVVVVEQSSEGSFAAVTRRIRTGFLSWETITLNKFVDFMIRAKETEWVKDDKITVYNPDGTVDCDVTGGVRLRGNTTQDYPKKPFAVKFTESKPVLGMPAHKRWVLLANWLDHSMIRNTVAFNIAQAVEYAWRDSRGAIGDGIPWSVHGQNVELVFIENGEAHHVGNYYLCEQIKIDENRLNIKESYEDVLSTNIADCGYLLEFDSKEDNDTKYTTSNGIPVKLKDDAIAGTSLYTAVSQKVQNIENYLDAGNYTEAYKMLDINSVIDQWLILELTMNREYGDPGSVYMFMDGDGKLCSGPVWDFDRGTFQNQEKAKSLGNSDRIKADNEWMCWRSAETYIWYKQLIKDKTFQETVKARWAVIKPYLDMIPDVIRYYGESQAVSYTYDSKMWPTNKADIQRFKYDFSDWSGDETLGANGNYQEVIENFVTVYNERLAGMDALITSGKFTK